MALIEARLDCITGITTYVEMTAEEEAGHLALQEEAQAGLLGEAQAREAAVTQRQADLEAVKAALPPEAAEALHRLLGGA